MRQFLRITGTLLCLTCYFNVGSAQPNIDGDLSDPEYILLGKKDTFYNSFPNHELGALYYYTFLDTLFLGIACELDIIPVPPATPSTTTPEDPSNIVLFFDWSDHVGRGADSLDPGRIGGPGVFISWGGLNHAVMDFDADFALAFNTGNNDEVIVMDAVHYGPSSIEPIVADSIYGPDLLQLDSVATHEISSVFGGVSGGTITYAYKNGYVSNNDKLHGIELKIPYNAFSGVTASSGMCLFTALTGKKGHISNEIIPGNPLSSTNLGDGYNFAAVPGQEYCASIIQILPVELVMFDGLQKSGRNYLSWATASELNSRSFEIQRRVPRKNWETVGEVPAKGTSSAVHRYEYIDATPSALRNEYRLKQIDLDGAIHYSPMIVIESTFGSQMDFMVYPNPAHDRVFVYTGQPLDSDAQIQIVDMAGRVLLEQQMEAGSRDANVSLSGLNQGLHLVRLQVGGVAMHQKLVIR
ncbi:MAG: T9SS type A sorting domain-containing protein [Bacteroidia bacterium]